MSPFGVIRLLGLGNKPFQVELVRRNGWRGLLLQLGPLLRLAFLGGGSSN